MVAFTIGQVVTIKAAIRDFCGTNSFYEINDINCAVGPQTINIQPFSCLPANGVELQFYWSNASNDTAQVHTCDQAYNIRLLGTATTDAQGIATIQHTIDQEDVLHYTNNTFFDLKVCINNANTQPNLVGDVRRNYQPDSIFLGIDQCAGVICLNQCFGLDLYRMKCDPATGTCVQDVLKESNSQLCTATHFIAYDLSFLPTEFLDLIGPNIEAIANSLSGYLTLPAGIQFLGCDYVYGNFVVYLKEVPAQGISSLAIGDTLRNAAAIIGSALVFIIGAVIVVVVGGVPGAVIGGIVAAFAAYTMSYVIADIGGEVSSGTSGGINNTELTNAGAKFMNSTLSGCESVTCSDPTLTQDQKALCIKNCYVNLFTNWEGYQGDVYPDANHTPLTNALTDIQACHDAYNSSAKTQQDYDTLVACLQLKSSEGLNQDKDNTLQTYPPDAPAGSTVSPTSDCWIPGITPGSCILTASTGKTIALVGGVLVGGYFLLKVIKK